MPKHKRKWGNKTKKQECLAKMQLYNNTPKITKKKRKIRVTDQE